MKLAVPEHLGRIAPVFDCCRRVMIVVERPLEEMLVHNEAWASVPRFFRATRLVELQVEVLVCGGISCWMEDEVRRRGIRLIPWVAGDVWEILGALRDGRIYDPQYAMPGRGRCARRYRGPRYAVSARVSTMFKKE
jgi:predicted Fe-Mo cluster-binding NifX family protein